MVSLHSFRILNSWHCQTHRLSGKHLIDGVVILLCQDGKFAVLLLLQPFKDSLVL